MEFLKILDHLIQIHFKYHVNAILFQEKDTISHKVAIFLWRDELYKCPLSSFYCPMKRAFKNTRHAIIDDSFKAKICVVSI